MTFRIDNISRALNDMTLKRRIAKLEEMRSLSANVIPEDLSQLTPAEQYRLLCDGLLPSYPSVANTTRSAINLTPEQAYREMCEAGRG